MPRKLTSEEKGDSLIRLLHDNHSNASDEVEQQALALIDGGADLSRIDSVMGSALSLCAFFGHTRIAMTLIEKGAPLDLSDSAFHQTALMSAADTGQEDIACALIDAGANPVLKDKEGETALMKARKRNNNPSLMTLLEQYEEDYLWKNHQVIPKQFKKMLEQGLPVTQPIAHKKLSPKKGPFSP